MKNIIITLIVVLLGLVLIPTTTSAQQDAEYTQYMFNTISYNPAYAGSRGIISTTALYREQWVGIDGRPTSGVLGIHGPLRDSNSALGLWGEYDKIGLHKQVRIFGVYSYHIPMNNGSKLSLGVQAGGRMYSFNAEGIVDGALNSNATESKFLPNVGAGLYLYDKMYFVGLSAPHLLGQKLFDDTSNTDSFNNLENHYYATAGVVLPITNGLKFRPTALLKVVPDAPLELDVTAHFLLKEMIWLGAAWRSGDSIDFLAELQATQQLRVGYAYDLTTSELKFHKPNTHEVMLGYDFCYKQSNTVTPRYF